MRGAGSGLFSRPAVTTPIYGLHGPIKTRFERVERGLSLCCRFAGKGCSMDKGLNRGAVLAVILAVANTGFADERPYLDAMFGPAPQASQPVPIPQPHVDPIRREMAYASAEPAGTVIVDTGNHALYLILGEGRALRYAIAVGREGFGFTGRFPVSAKREWPSWTPTAEMHARQPGLPATVPGGPNNPLGARALYLGDTLYRIHGTNEPWTIGTDVSSGCIRMTNADVTDLYARVAVGAQVIVI